MYILLFEVCLQYGIVFRSQYLDQVLCLETFMEPSHYRVQLQNISYNLICFHQSH